jgi:GNAT superfamily N-acetyltransferase
VDVTITVRPAAGGDAGRLAEVNMRSWQDAYAGIVPATYLEAMDLDRYQRMWAARVADAAPESRILVGDLDGVVAGYVAVGRCRPQHDRPGEPVEELGEVLAIYVDPPSRALGVGLAMHQAGAEWLADTGFSEAVAWVLAANDAGLNWYRRQGWTADGATSRWTGAGVSLPEVRLRRRVG